ncbi:MAG: isocitrate/isopropylmalate dehydrogenase family protein [Thermoplasmatota archaeon]
MKHEKPRVAVLPGDGIGPEVMAVAVRALEASGFQATYVEHDVGWSCWRETGTALPNATLQACRDADAILFGAITSKPEEEAQRELAPHLRGRASYRSPILQLRQKLHLSTNIRPCQGNGVDLVLFRENTEDLYAGFEASPVPELLAKTFPGLPVGPDAAVSLRVVTRAASRRIAEAAFAYAARNGRRRVTLLEKANVLRQTGGLMRSAFHGAGAGYPGIAQDEMNIDAACARLVSRPGEFDVVVASNLFGDIFSDIAAEVAGGLPWAASANVGEKHALFEPIHGSAPDIAGRGIANPCGAVRAAAMMARHLGQTGAAALLEGAVQQLAARPLANDMTTARWEREVLALLSPIPA